MNNIYVVQVGTADGSSYATNVITRDIRLQGENVEKILVNYFERLKTLDYKMSGISKEQIQGELYETLTSEIGDINDKISIIEQKADRIDLLVQSMDGTSEINITDQLIEAVSQGIRITADNIDLCGYVSNRTVTDEDGTEVIVEGNWHVDEDGNAGFQSLAVEENMSCDNLVVTEITSASYPKVLTGNIDVYIDPANGSDDSEITDEAIFKSIDGLFDKLPKDLNGHLVNIVLRSNITENIVVNYFNRGRIHLFLNGFTINGWIREYLCECEFWVYGGSNADSMTYGTIMPPALFNDAGTHSAIYLQKSKWASLRYLNIYGCSKDQSSCAVNVTEGMDCMIRNCKFYDCYDGVYATMLASVYGSDTTGRATRRGWWAATGSQIFINSTTQLGGSSANTYSSSAGFINQQGTPSYQSTTPSDTNTNNPNGDTSTSQSATRTVTYNATYADTYRSTVYNNWKKDGTARQGNWGYGNCSGCWFFGSQFTNLKNKTIKSVKITIKRQTGGYRRANNVVIKMHNHSSRPSGAPNFISGWSKSVSLNVGSSATVTITDSAVLNAIQAGTVKGFGVQSSYTQNNYAVCSGTCKVVITYAD